MPTNNKRSKSGRNWATIVYPESAPNDWQKLFKEKHIPCFVSPLHDKDVTEEGQSKKAHYHVLLAFKGNKTENSVKPLVQAFGGVGLERVSDLHSYARYLCHLDEWDKPQYGIHEVKAYGGLNYKKYEIAKQSYEDTVFDVITAIRGVGLESYHEVVDFCVQERPDLVRFVIKNAFAINTYLKPKKE